MKLNSGELAFNKNTNSNLIAVSYMYDDCIRRCCNCNVVKKWVADKWGIGMRNWLSFSSCLDRFESRCGWLFMEELCLLIVPYYC